MSKIDLTIAISELVETANQQRGRDISIRLRDALNSIAQLDSIDHDSRQLYVAEALSQIDSPTGLGMIAIFLGAGAENHADPRPVLPHLIENLMRLCQQVEVLDNESNLQLDEELEAGLELFSQGTVAHLARDSEFLQKLRDDQATIDELERVEPYSIGVVWILELLQKVSGKLVVLHGEKYVGVEVAYHNISNCFHLFTLLQCALEGKMPGARPADPKVLAVARGELHAECNDESWWHYGQPTSSLPNLQTSVWGEASPLSIQEIGDRQVMLLWPPILKGRSWDAGFFGPAIHAAPASVEFIRNLSAEEVVSLRTRIGVPEVHAKRPWWKLW